MTERRRFPRYLTKLYAYFPKDPNPYPVKNISFKGLFIKTDKPLNTDKRLVFFELELPDIGRIPIYGYITHFGTPEEPGLGIEIIEIDNNLKAVFSLYLKALHYLNEAKSAYEKIKESIYEEEE